MPASRTHRSVVSDYVALAKPRITLLLLITAVGSMFLAAEGRPDPLLVALVVSVRLLDFSWPMPPSWNWGST